MSRCMIIAEAGINHNGLTALALELVDEAKEAGADAIKFQTYNPATILRDNDPDKDMLIQLALSFVSFVDISNHCRKVGIEFLSTPECPETLHFLIEHCGMARIKIGSGDLTNTKLLESAKNTGLPVLLSTGMATLPEIVMVADRMINKPSYESWNRLTVLHCVSCYPTAYERANLSVITTLKTMYPNVGYSDHTIGAVAPIAAVALGASVIEKHFTLDTRVPGPDHFMSMPPHEFKQMVSDIRCAEMMMGDGHKMPCEEELELAKIVRKGPDGKRGIAA